MRKFYKQYQAQEKLQRAAEELSWTHNMVIVDKCKSLEESLFYMAMARMYGWTRNVLIHHIEGKAINSIF